MPKNRDPAADIAALKYEEAASELEGLVQTMETGQLSLEASLAAYQRGTLLLRHCQRQLEDAEHRLRILDQDELKPLSLDAGKTS